MKLLKVTRKGQVTVPKEYRDALGIKEGDFVNIELRKGEIVISKPGFPEPGEPVGNEMFKKVMRILEEERRSWS